MRAVVDCHMVGQSGSGDAGNARYAATLAGALRETAGAGDDVWALIAHARGVAELPEGVPHAGVGAGNAGRLLVGARRVLRTLGADAAVFTYIAPPRTPCALALAVHDASFVTHPQWLGPRARAVLGALVPRSARAAGVVLALSASAREEIVAALGVPAGRVRVVTPAPAAVFGPRPGAEARVAARFGLGRYCLAVGDLGPRKNLPALAAALGALGDGGLELVLAGRPAGAEAALAAAPRVRLLGRVSDDELADLYAAAAVTAFPSLHEGFGLPAVEAMACGSPLVVSDRGALPEVAGDAALVVPPTVDGIAQGLRAALEPATADRLRAAGPTRAARFSTARMGEEAWAALRAAVAAGEAGA
jgi:glycosyltransferase involved in cell wall biosynthesis